MVALASAKGCGARRHFARKRQALAAFGLATEFGERRHRAIATRRARGITNLILAKGIADADDHELASQQMLRGVITDSSG